MRIAFDLDDTLIPCGRAFPLEPPTLRARCLGAEPLRRGAVRLLKQLRARGCQLWVYTSSLRSPWAIRFLFLCYGVWLSGVVNSDRHVRRLRHAFPAQRHLSKYPPAFGIDLLVDDSEGVREEGRLHDFRVLCVRPDDPDWAARVLAAVI